MTPSPLVTERLVLRRLVEDDAPFILELVNDPDWLRYIGDKGVRTLEDARRYIADGPATSYATHGFGLYHAARRDGVPVGLCGLIRRDTLDDVDVGFAFLPDHRRQGYGVEATRAVLEHGVRDFDLRRIVAITSLDNEGSRRLLERVGFEFERLIDGPTVGERLRLFGWSAP